MNEVRTPESDDGASSALRRIADSTPSGGEELFRVVYEDLRRIAGRYMRGQRSDHTLQPTSLIHEAYLRLVRAEGTFNDRRHFVRAAASAMRSILVDHARAKGCDRRTARGGRVPLDDIAEDYVARSGDLVALDDALVRLNEVDPELVRLVDLRFFAGLSIEECAALLELPEKQVERDLRIARGWLRRELS